jgi:spore photoproduct lyase
MFKPKRVIWEKDSLAYPLGQSLHEYFREKDGVEIIIADANRIGRSLPGENLRERYGEGKNTLVVGVKKSLSFQTCKPSAHYQLPLVSGCIGQCEYCYLNTQLGDKPFVRVHVNVEEILDKAQKYIRERFPEKTLFEGAATSDPIPVEPYTGALKKAVRFFGEQSGAGFRFVTKFSDIDSLLEVPHNGRTEVRFSLNTERVIRDYEHRTASAKSRIQAAARLVEAGYPVGFLIAPVFLYENWQAEYRELLQELKASLPPCRPSTPGFEIITHRYTLKAKSRILEIFPDTTLDMREENRAFRFGQFGYGKYMYPKEGMDEIKDFFRNEIGRLFDRQAIRYIV